MSRNEIDDSKAYKVYIKTKKGYELKEFCIKRNHPLFDEVKNYFEYLNDKRKEEYKEYD